MLYPGLCLLEYAPNLSVGRGTDAPFEQLGSDFIDGPELSAYLNKRGIAGVRVYPTRFTPTESKFQGVAIQGVRFTITERERLDPIHLGLEVAVAIQKLYPGKLDFAVNRKLIGNDKVITLLQSGASAENIEASYKDTTKAFLKIRQKYMIYNADQ